MAKQIYIDENGNEHLVSGTINTASMLPVSAGSSTSTADAIDAKQNKIKRKSIPVTIGTATYSDFLYADVAVNDVPKANIIGMYISGNPTNRPAFAILLDGNATTIRLFANSYSQNSTFNVILTYFE